jgi:hypothetical protein
LSQTGTIVAVRPTFVPLRGGNPMTRPVITPAFLFDLDGTLIDSVY